ncbi:anti-sigma factor [Paracoccus actinidiae]|jgi:anti-sigma-K factor RskA|uniref:anti-sigma factor n=1 Tax=Paracoccus actinidiae TaxID=3064531 RepID=UPI0027D2B8AC|nr:anti-sigma factor [Paracoccus sp. M09]
MSVDTDLPEGGDDILAAEFALGVLPDEDQAALARRADIDPAFARLVADWQDRLLPLADEFAPAVLPPAVKGALDLRLFGAVPERPGAWRSLALWRGLTAAATAAFLLALSLPLLSPPPPTPEMRLVALLAHEGSNVHYMAVYDTDDGAVGLSHLSGNPAPGQDFELWVIRDPQRPPVSLGVIPAGEAAAHLAVDDRTRALVEAGAQLAITLEPQGGSATGLPSGAVVAAGDLRGI